MYREFELIQKIKALFPTSEGVTIGIGDDGAVLDPGRFDLVTTDTLVEDVHFKRDWSSPEDIGWKAVASNLSDIAAMGGGPGVLFLNLILPVGIDASYVDGLLLGMKQALDALVPDSFQVSLAGGDVTSTRGPMVISMTLLGESSPAGPQLRHGAVPGDRIILIGPLGLAAAGLEMLRLCDSGDAQRADIEDEFADVLSVHRRPQPRVYEGAILGLYGVPSAMLDISDGFLQDLGHILKASKVGASIESHGLPRHPSLIKCCERFHLSALDLILTGGEDYELLLTVPPARMPKLWELARRYEWDVYDVGEVRSASEQLRVLGPDGVPMELPSQHGFVHLFDEDPA